LNVPYFSGEVAENVMDPNMFLFSGLLCGASISNGARYNYEDDPASTYVGTTSYLYPGIMPQGWGPWKSAHE
jgi:hypothetical protein